MGIWRCFTLPNRMRSSGGLIQVASGGPCRSCFPLNDAQSSRLSLCTCPLLPTAGCPFLEGDVSVLVDPTCPPVEPRVCKGSHVPKVRGACEAFLTGMRSSVIWKGPDAGSPSGLLRDVFRSDDQGKGPRDNRRRKGQQRKQKEERGEAMASRSLPSPHQVAGVPRSQREGANQSCLTRMSPEGLDVGTVGIGYKSIHVNVTDRRLTSAPWRKRNPPGPAYPTFAIHRCRRRRRASAGGSSAHRSSAGVCTSAPSPSPLPLPPRARQPSLATGRKPASRDVPGIEEVGSVWETASPIEALPESADQCSIVHARHHRINHPRSDLAGHPIPSIGMENGKLPASRFPNELRRHSSRPRPEHNTAKLLRR